MRVVFVNLHGNEFLVKTLNKMIFRQSVAIKHKYFLDYLLANPDVEVCSFINKHGFSMSYTSADSWLRVFRFLVQLMSETKKEQNTWQNESKLSNAVNANIAKEYVPVETQGQVFPATTQTNTTFTITL